MEKHRRNNLRPIAIAVILAFTAEQAAMAAPALPTIVPASLKPAINFRLPESVAVVDDSYKAPGDSKLLILIQDAHTNDSGQMNVARALDEILPKEDINTVFTEADSGDVSVGYMKPFFDKKVRQDVARKLVRKGEMRGHDYANLVGDRDFTLWGVEDPALYLETLKTYQGLVERRDRVRVYLDRVQRSVETLKNDFFAQDLKNLDALRAKHNSGDRSLADYSEDLLKAADAAGFDASRYANIKYLRKLRNLEKKIDFKAASSEEREAMKTLPQADREELLAVHKKKGPQAAAGEDGFYALFADKLNGRDASFPNLRKYFDYLKEMRRMNALGVVGEIHEFEEQLFLTMAKTRDEAVLWVFGRNLEMLQDLIALKVSPEDFNRIRSDKSLFDMRLITGFLNRKIADLDLHYENAVTLEASYDAAREDAFHFYDLTLSRDRVFMDQVVSKMEKDQINKAVLITGGYHSPNLKAMLRGAGYSYVSLLPQVLAETDTARYEKLLLSQIKGLDADNSENTRVASNGRTSSKEAAMNQAMGPAELVGELVSGARLGIVPAALSQRISVRGSLSNDARPTAGDGARMASDEDSVITPTIVEIRISESVRLDKKRFSIGLDVDRTANGDYELVLSLDDKDPDLDFFVDDVRLDVDEAAHRPDNTQQYLRSPIGPGATNYHIPIVVKKAFGGVLGTIYVQLTGLADVNTFEGKGGAEGPYHVTIQANWVPIISEGARLAELTQERTTKLEAMAANKWKPEVVPTVKDWYASPFVSVEQRAALDKLIDDGKADQIEAGFDSPTGVLMPGTAGVRSKLENLAEGKVGPNYFSRTTVMQYVEAHIRWYKETSQTGQALITREVRDGSDEYADLAVRMLLAAGIPVTVVSRPVSTPFASFLSHWFGKLKQLVNKYAATIIVSTVFTLQLSASHNTFLDNGIKIMGSAGEQLMPEALQEITSRTPKLSETNVTSPHEGSLQEFVESGLYSDLSFEEELDAEEAYFDAIDQTMEEGYAGVLASAREKGFKFVYTAFNGASGPATQRLLGRLGYVEDRDYYLVKDEASGIDEITPLSDPGLGDQANQSARARSTSDPLGKNNLNAAQAIANKHNVPVVFAHDPDGDRLVVSIKVNGKWRTLSGNDNSVLMLHDRLSNGVMPDDDYMIVRSHATTRLIDFIAAKFNRKVIVTGVGFKYIAALILSLRQRVGVIGRRFLGMEESGGTSHGHVAEKDGMSGLIQMLIVASRAHAQESGAAKDLADALLEIAYEFGVLGDDITSLEFGDKTTTAPQINARREAVKTGLEGLEDGSSLGALTITGPLKKSVKVDELDGLEVHDGYDMIVTDQEGVQWRVLIRFSGTEPKSKFMISLVEPRQLSEKSHEALAALNQELKTKTEAIGQELSGVIGAMALNAEAPVASTPGQGATPEDSYHAEAPNTNPGMVDQYVKMAQESGVGEEAIRTRLRQINALIAPANFTTRENVEPAIALHRIVWASIYADSNPESDVAKAVRAQSYLNLEAIFDRQLPSSFDSAVASMIGSDQAGPAGVLLNQVQAGFFGMPTTTDAQRVVFLAAVLNGDRSQTQQVLQGAGLSDLAEHFSQSAVEATVESSVSTDRGATARDWGEPDAFSTTVDFSGSQQGLSNIHLDVRFADGNLYVTLDEADEDADFGGPRVTKPTSTVSRLEEETSDVNFHAPNFLFKRTVTVVHSDDRTVVNGVVTIEMRRLKPGPFVIDETFEVLLHFDGLETSAATNSVLASVKKVRAIQQGLVGLGSAPADDEFLSGAQEGLKQKLQNEFMVLAKAASDLERESNKRKRYIGSKRHEDRRLQEAAVALGEAERILDSANKDVERYIYGPIRAHARKLRPHAEGILSVLAALASSREDLGSATSLVRQFLNNALPQIEEGRLPSFDITRVKTALDDLESALGSDYPSELALLDNWLNEFGSDVEVAWANFNQLRTTMMNGVQQLDVNLPGRKALTERLASIFDRAERESQAGYWQAAYNLIDELDYVAPAEQHQAVAILEANFGFSVRKVLERSRAYEDGAVRSQRAKEVAEKLAASGQTKVDLKLPETSMDSVVVNPGASDDVFVFEQQMSRGMTPLEQGTVNKLIPQENRVSADEQKRLERVAGQLNVVIVPLAGGLSTRGGIFANHVINWTRGTVRLLDARIAWFAQAARKFKSTSLLILKSHYTHGRVETALADNPLADMSVFNSVMTADSSATPIYEVVDGKVKIYDPYSPKGLGNPSHFDALTQIIFSGRAGDILAAHSENDPVYISYANMNVLTSTASPEQFALFHEIRQKARDNGDEVPFVFFELAPSWGEKGGTLVALRTRYTQARAQGNSRLKAFKLAIIDSFLIPSGKAAEMLEERENYGAFNTNAAGMELRDALKHIFQGSDVDIDRDLTTEAMNDPEVRARVMGAVNRRFVAVTTPDQFEDLDLAEQFPVFPEVKEVNGRTRVQPSAMLNTLATLGRTVYFVSPRAFYADPDSPGLNGSYMSGKKGPDDDLKIQLADIKEQLPKLRAKLDGKSQDDPQYAGDFEKLGLLETAQSDLEQLILNDPYSTNLERFVGIASENGQLIFSADAIPGGIDAFETISIAIRGLAEETTYEAVVRIEGQPEVSLTINGNDPNAEFVALWNALPHDLEYFAPVISNTSTGKQVVFQAIPSARLVDAREPVIGTDASKANAGARLADDKAQEAVTRAELVYGKAAVVENITDLTEDERILAAYFGEQLLRRSNLTSLPKEDWLAFDVASGDASKVIVFRPEMTSNGISVSLTDSGNNMFSRNTEILKTAVEQRRQEGGQAVRAQFASADDEVDANVRLFSLVNEYKAAAQNAPATVALLELTALKDIVDLTGLDAPAHLKAAVDQYAAETLAKTSLRPNDRYALLLSGSGSVGEAFVASLFERYPDLKGLVKIVSAEVELGNDTVLAAALRSGEGPTIDLNEHVVYQIGSGQKGDKFEIATFNLGVEKTQFVKRKGVVASLLDPKTLALRLLGAVNVTYEGAEISEVRSELSTVSEFRDPAEVHNIKNRFFDPKVAFDSAKALLDAVRSDTSKYKLRPFRVANALAFMKRMIAQVATAA